ncbi:MAG: DUF3307 domain-containing protein [Paludibacteraceae bacterium]|nr:DUF3307 domain-containing protein [Paludibacteraceae bacterium]
MNSTLFLSLVLAHIIGDFYLQTDECCKQKETRRFKSWFLYVHAIIIGLLSWIIVPSCNFGLWALLIAVSHFAIDAVKIHCPKGLWSFFIDQLLHLGILITIPNIYEPAKELPLQMIDFSGSFSMLLLILAILLCMKPANILIKLVLEKYQVGESESCNNIKNAGALIGNLERILTIVFVLLGQFEAIGFIVAAKSILRFKDTDTAKTEYVLAGTFLSFGIAILCGLMTRI